MISHVILGLDLDSDIMLNVDAWQTSLNAQGKRPVTIQSYTDACRLLDDYLKSQGMARLVSDINRDHVESHIAWLLGERLATTAGIRFRSLRVFFGWLVDEGEIKASPMARMRPRPSKTR